MKLTIILLVLALLYSIWWNVILSLKTKTATLGTKDSKERLRVKKVKRDTSAIYVHTQDQVSDTWNVLHGLSDKDVFVKVFDCDGVERNPIITRLDKDRLTLQSNVPFKGEVVVISFK